MDEWEKFDETSLLELNHTIILKESVMILK